jgi:hypothetical protein
MYYLLFYIIFDVEPPHEDNDNSRDSGQTLFYSPFLFIGISVS